MRTTGVRRSVVTRRSLAAGAIAAAAALAPPLGPAAATASPPPDPATTTVFQVPVRYVAGCGTNLFMCYTVPPMTTVTPTASPTAPGVVTFTTEPPTRTWAGTANCVEVSVTWRNLTTGAAGTTALRRVPPVANDWCRYVPAQATTGSGTVAATADLGPADLGTYRIPVNPGIGVFPVR